MSIQQRPAPPRVRRGRRVLVPATVALVAVALFGGGILATTAYFTSQATVTGQSATTATVKVEAGTAAGSGPIAVTDLLPGDSASTTIDIENAGTGAVSLAVRLPVDASSHALLDAALEASVTIGTTTVTKTLADWQTGAFWIATPFAATDTLTTTVDIELPATAADDALQGVTSEFSVRVEAIQARNVTAPTTTGWIAD